MLIYFFSVFEMIYLQGIYYKERHWGQMAIITKRRHPTYTVIGTGNNMKTYIIGTYVEFTT